ncbi:hypothetical protein [Microbacterium lacticum]|uniref:DNA-directed RNA polymerase specialized sigma24 family protein n=1 Tax=Microbacterium lacticum TaxID=33885 RepID=A0A4Y3UJ99_9MICO|nr:hypothetical protein [Microbacterium lacticum]TQN00433.1 DNA-directed RNA polymerase specialized sigma24 family protein [Microbacterium lacticum]GEB94383.1 hypothetical protein MLA01_06020 [Microbacterium lacticum]GGN17954.1 hypothetical protein GCM10009724_09680 [Microbacterium lacticum]
MTNVENMVTEFLPQMRAHIIGKYGWLERRGNCMITVDDMIQVASIALLRHVDRWPRIAADRGWDPNNNDGAFYVMLKEDVKRSIMKYRRREAGDPEPGEQNPIAVSFDDHPLFEHGGEGENTDAEYRTSLNAPSMLPHWKMLQSTVVDYYVFLQKRDKVQIALRYFDELSHASTAELIGISTAASKRRITTLRSGWVDHARNQFTDHYVPLADPAQNLRWTPPPALEAYVRDRHRMNLDEYLGIVTIAFREDVSYLTDILSEGRHYGATAHAASRALSPFQEAQVDKWMSSGMSQKQIADDLGVAYHHVNQYVKSGRRSVYAA